MLRQITGVAGISLWAGLVVVAVISGFEGKANGEPMFENLPEGWKVEKSFVIPIDQTAAISLKLGGKISKLTNTILSIEGRHLQVNVLHCPTEKEAEKIYKAVLKAHNGLEAAAARDGRMVIEFAKCDDVELMNRVQLALGFADVRLDRIARKFIKKVPDGWQIEESFIVPKDQAAAIGKKLGGGVKNLSNTIFSVQGRRFQVNIFECITPRVADEIYRNILGTKGDPAFCLKFGYAVVEFVGDDIELAKKAPSELELELAADSIRGQAGELDINAKINQLNNRTATFDRVIQLFGEPVKYIWGNKIFEKNELPDRYIMVYPDGFHIFMKDGRVAEFQHEGVDGYIWLGKLQMGSSLEEILEVIGRPEKTVTGQDRPNEFEDGVLYKDIDGKEGDCYYGREKEGVRFFFQDYKVTAIYTTPRGFEMGRRFRGAAGSASGTARVNHLKTLAKGFVHLLANGDSEKVAENFNEKMKESLSAEELQQVWDSLVVKQGAFVKQLGTRSEKIGQYDVIFVTCEFENTVLDVKVVFDSEKQIAGLFFIPSRR